MNDLNVLLVALAGLGSTLATGGIKWLVAWVTGFEAKADSAVTKALGNLSPVLVVALSFALPKVWVLLHLPGTVPDAQIVANAPVAAVVGILAREAYILIFHKAPPTGVA